MTATQTIENKAAPQGIDRYAEEITGYVRSPSDVLRVVVFALATLLLLVLARWAPDAVLGLESDVVALFRFIGPTVELILLGVLVLVTLAALAFVWVTPLVTRRYRLFGYVVVANLAVALLLWGIEWFVNQGNPGEPLNVVAQRAGLSGQGRLDVASIGQLTASFVLLAPFVSRRWRRAGAVTIVLISLLGLLATEVIPVTLPIVLALGAAVGSGVLLAFGRPNGRPTQAAIAASLTSSGLPLASLERASVDARGSVPYFATLTDGGHVFAKVLGSDERAADLMFRAYRFVRLKNVGDERPFSSLRRTVEHEALVSLMARDVGVRTPRLRAVADVGRDSLLLSYDLIDGKSLDRLPDEAVTDEVLRGIWQQVAILRRHRIAHRDLRRANVFLDSSGAPWLIDFGFSEIAASQALLDADVAQLVVALALTVGPERSVDTAIAELGPDAVAAGLPRLQPNTFSGATRTELKQRKGMLEQVRDTITDRTGVAAPKLEELERVSLKTIFTIVMLVAVTYFLLPQLADVPGVIGRVKEANWAWFPLILVMSAVTYLGAGISLTGSIPDRLRVVPTFLTQLASSFASKLAPAGLGGMALNVRFLQKEGVDLAVATSGVGLNSVAGFAVHVFLLTVFAVWAGRDVFGSLHLPDPQVLLWGVLVVFVLAAVMFAVPAFRRLIVTKLLPILRTSVGGVGAVLRSPGKLALLLGGSAVVTFSYVVAVYLSTRAFGGDLRFATVGAVYLAGSALATVAPTPGGLGALEAALIAGLVAAGMDNTIAIPAVFLYRLATFWLPILPGWACFTWLRREEYV